MADARTLTAKLVEGVEDVELTFHDNRSGNRTFKAPIPQFSTLLTEWVSTPTTPQVLNGVGNGTPLAEVQAALRNPSAWSVNGLTLPMRYALLVHKQVRIAVHTRPAQEMDLRYCDEDDGDPIKMRFLVPPRVVAGIWNGNALQSGMILLAESEQHLPKAFNDTEARLTPWPWGNGFSEGGQVCWGTTTRPAYGQDGVSNVDHAFFTSIFNSDICRYPNDGDHYNENAGEHHNLLSWYEHQRGRWPVVCTLPARTSGMGQVSLFDALDYVLRVPR